MATSETTASKKKAAPKKKAPKRSAAKKKVEKVSRKDKALAVVAKLKGRYAGKIFLGHEYTMPWLLKRLPTGILELDIALQGGFPAGGFTMLYGPESIGKNYLANLVMANQQLFLGDDCNIAVVSTEMPYDKTQGKSCDVQIGFSELEIAALDRAYFDDTGDHLSDEYKAHLRLEIGTFVTSPPTTAESALQIALELIASRQFDVILIDSFGSLLPEEDDDKDMEQNAKVGGASGLNTRFARKMNTAFAPDKDGNPNMTCVIGINQVRDNMDRANKYSPKTKETGGWALKHARFVGIELSKYGKAKVKEGKKDVVVGKVIRWQVTKQKAGGHEGAEGFYEWHWDKAGIYREMESLRAAIKYGVVDKSGSWYSYKGDRIGQGLQNSANYIRDHDLLGEIEEAVLHAAGVRCNYTYSPDDE